MTREEALVKLDFVAWLREERDICDQQARDEEHALALSLGCTYMATFPNGSPCYYPWRFGGDCFCQASYAIRAAMEGLK